MNTSHHWFPKNEYFSPKSTVWYLRELVVRLQKPMVRSIHLLCDDPGSVMIQAQCSELARDRFIAFVYFNFFFFSKTVWTPHGIHWCRCSKGNIIGETKREKDSPLFCFVLFFFFWSLESNGHPLIRGFSLLFLPRFPPSSSKGCLKGLPIMVP